MYYPSQEPAHNVGRVPRLTVELTEEPRKIAVVSLVPAALGKFVPGGLGGGEGRLPFWRDRSGQDRQTLNRDLPPRAVRDLCCDPCDKVLNFFGWHRCGIESRTVDEPRVALS